MTNMKMLLVVASLGVAAFACSKPDDCQRVADKSAQMFERLAADKRAAAKQKFLDECRKPDSRMKKDPTFACIRDAKGEAAVKTCITQGMTSYVSKSRATEPAPATAPAPDGGAQTTTTGSEPAAGSD